MEEVTLRVKLPGKVSEETKRVIERELELEALRIYLELKSKKKRRKLPVEKYMGIQGTPTGFLQGVAQHKEGLQRSKVFTGRSPFQGV